MRRNPLLLLLWTFLFPIAPMAMETAIEPEISTYNSDNRPAISTEMMKAEALTTEAIKAETDKDPKKDEKKELKIKDVFHIYGKRKNVVMVELSKDMLETYNITYYKGITIKNDPEALAFVRKCLEKDQDGAKKIKEVLSDGKIISAYYQIPMEDSPVNRFILFKVSKKGVITLIYIEGELDSDDLITILFTKKDL